MSHLRADPHPELHRPERRRRTWPPHLHRWSILTMTTNPQVCELAFKTSPAWRDTGPPSDLDSGLEEYSLQGNSYQAG
jgi:hypothetical protein